MPEPFARGYAAQDELDILYDEQTIARTVASLGERISRDCAGRDVLLVGILRGAALFLADLARSLTVPADLAFIEASSYGSGTASSGTVRITKDTECDLSGRHVLIVDCIVDSGRTLAAVTELFRKRGPASLGTVVLLDKKTHRALEIAADYVGFEVPDRFLVGYGLDKAGRYRNLPYIAAVRSGPAASS